MLHHQEEQDYADLIAMQNARDAGRILTQPHRLPSEQYTRSDCEVVLTIRASHHGCPFSNAPLARAICESLLRYRKMRSLILYCYCLMPD